MIRKASISAILVSLLAAAPAPAPAAATDYVDQLTTLSQLSSDGHYREAIAGYQRLQAQPGTPAWLKAASEYEIAELHGALHETGAAIASLGRSVQLGYDDCLSPRKAERLAAVLADPKAAQALAAMTIREADFRELAWLKQEVEFAGHDAKMMITDNVDRVDQHATEIPQARLPTRATTSAAVLYWRQQLLLMQKAQRDFVKQSDEERMVHAAKMGIVAGGSDAAALASARAADAAAASRRADMQRRAFVAPPASAAPPESCNALADRKR